jgi:hypothetical protein
MEPPKGQIRKYLKKHIIDYISSKPHCNLKWITRKICFSGMNPGELANVFAELKEHMDNDKFWLIFNICRNVNFDCKELK